MFGSMPTPWSDAVLAVMDFHVACGGGVGAAADRVLVIVDEGKLDPERLFQRVDESVDRAVALAFDGKRRPVGLAQRRDELAAVRAGRDRLLLDERHRRVVEKKGLAEQPPQFGRGQLLAIGVHPLLRDF